jgi:hypothetical protein
MVMQTCITSPIQFPFLKPSCKKAHLRAAISLLGWRQLILINRPCVNPRRFFGRAPTELAGVADCYTVRVEEFSFGPIAQPYEKKRLAVS